MNATCTFSVRVTGTATGDKLNTITRISSAQRSTRGITASATLSVIAAPATPVPPPPLIPQVQQNQAAVAVIQGIAGNGTRNNTPVPARPAAVQPAAVSPATAGVLPQLRPPSTGDAGLLALQP